MVYPLLTEYIEAIKSSQDNLDALKYLSPVLDDNGAPIMSSGNFAVVFKMEDKSSGKYYALKCFLRGQERRSESYRLISDELSKVDSPYLTTIKYLDKELFVDSRSTPETEFPVLLMDWVNGVNLDKYVRDHINDQYELSMLAYRFSQLAMWLLPQPFAHGDLKQDNILVKEDGSLVLVDYDGMYVPAMKGQLARELGSPDFRHPLRTESTFNEHIDDFSVVSILLSIKAIAVEPSLLDQFGAPDRLLFSINDYRNLNGSAVLRELYTIDNSELKMLCSVFTIALQMQDITLVSPQLLNIRIPIGYSNNRVYGTSSGHEYVDLGLSVKWATCNIGANSSVEYGNYYAWGESEIKNSYTWENYKYRISGDSSANIRINKYQISSEFSDIDNINNKVILEPIDDVAHLKWAGDWRLPIKAEIDELLEECTWEWFDKGNSEFEGVAGYKVTSNIAGYRDRFIFLPASGYRIDTKLCMDGKSGFVWIGSYATNNPFQACNLYFTTNGIQESDEDRFIGRTVRPVCPNESYSGTRVTQADLKNAWIDEFGVKYSIDKTKLLEAPEDLERYNIDKSVSIICNEAFSKCKWLLSIDMSNSVLHIGKRAFRYCTRLYDIKLSSCLITIGDNSFDGCYTLDSISLPISVKSIGNYAFHGCIIQSIDIPENVENIGKGAFSSCYKLNKISVASKNNNYDSRNDCNAIIESSSNKLISGCYNTIIPYGILSIGKCAFEYCSKITTITIPKGLQIIEDRAFDGCLGLTSINIPDSVTTIGNYAFSYCQKLSSITIPEKVERINKCVFSDCISLSSVVLHDKLISIGEDAFGSCEKLRNIKLPDSLKEIDSRAFSYSGLQSIEIPIGITKIKFQTFGCSKLKDVVIPGSVDVIGKNAFEHCLMEKIIIPNSVIKIESGAFSGSYKLKTVDIPYSVKYIESGAFACCFELEEVIFHNSSIWIADNIFFESYRLKKIFIPWNTRNEFCRMIPEWKDKMIEYCGFNNRHEYVDLGLSVKWATCNIGSEKPEGFGDYFAWGDAEKKDTYSWSSYKFANGSIDKLTKYCKDSRQGYNGYTDKKDQLELIDDVANSRWGGDWRMPTWNEFQELIDNCSSEWIILNGVSGYKFTSKKIGFTDRFVFLPASGMRQKAGVTVLYGKEGGYWSSSLYIDSCFAKGLFFDSDNHCVIKDLRCFGVSVRPVCP